MRTKICALLTLTVAFFASPANTESPKRFALTIKLDSRYNPKFTLCTSVDIGQPFQVEWSSGKVRSGIAGVLSAPEKGEYPLRLTVSQRYADVKAGNSLMMGHRLKLGEPKGLTNVVSSTFGDIEEQEVTLTQGDCPTDSNVNAK